MALRMTSWSTHQQSPYACAIPAAQRLIIGEVRVRRGDPGVIQDPRAALGAAFLLSRPGVERGFRDRPGARLPGVRRLNPA